MEILLVNVGDHSSALRVRALGFWDVGERLGSDETGSRASNGLMAAERGKE